jgi:hypothetical protein
MRDFLTAQETAKILGKRIDSLYNIVYAFDAKAMTNGSLWRANISNTLAHRWLALMVGDQGVSARRA